MPVWNILWPFGICILWSFGNSVVILYIFPRFGRFCQEKSGNPGRTRKSTIRFRNEKKELFGANVIMTFKIVSDEKMAENGGVLLKHEKYH
jgi:hypothetical protein